MNLKKSVPVVGAIALMLGVGMNLRYSLDDYGMKTNSLSLFVFAQSTSSGGGSMGSTTNGETINVDVVCEITHNITSSSGSSSGVSGGISAGIGNVGGGISGSTSSNTGSSTSTSVKETYKAIKTICKKVDNAVQICTPFDPCLPQ